MGLLAAVNVVLGLVTSGFTISFGGIAGVKIGLGGLPIILAGILLGPLAGGVVGIVSDLVGFLLVPMGPYMPHFTLTAALTGIIPCLVLKLTNGKREIPSFLHLLLGIGIGQAITTVILVPYFSYILFGLPLLYTVLGNAISQLISVPLYAYISLFILKSSKIRSMTDTASQK